MDTQMHHEIIMAGYGGQGVLKLGMTLAEAAMHEGRQVVWTPAYGPEMRGGPAFCTVIISSEPIGSPVVAGADTAIIMDNPSLPKYQQRVHEDGRIIINSSLVDAANVRTDRPCFPIRANHLAEEIGDTRVANMVLLGALLRITPLVTPASIIAAVSMAVSERNRYLIPLNERALLAGAEAVEALLAAC